MHAHGIKRIYIKSFGQYCREKVLECNGLIEWETIVEFNDGLKYYWTFSNYNKAKAKFIKIKQTTTEYYLVVWHECAKDDWHRLRKPFYEFLYGEK